MQAWLCVERWCSLPRSLEADRANYVIFGVTFVTPWTSYTTPPGQCVLNHSPIPSCYICAKFASFAKSAYSDCTYWWATLRSVGYTVLSIPDTAVFSGGTGIAKQQRLQITVRYFSLSGWGIARHTPHSPPRNTPSTLITKLLPEIVCLVLVV